MQANDDGYLLAGSSDGPWWGYSSWIIKTDPSGWEEWEYSTYDYRQECKSVVQTLDDCYVYGGYSSSFGPSARDMYLVKLESETTSVEDRLSNPNLQNLSPASPNPFSSTTIMNFSLPEATQASIAVFDISGRLVETLVDGSVEAGETQLYLMEVICLTEFI